MTPRRTVWDRQTDAMQYATGIANALVFCVVIWAIGAALLVWAFR